MGLEAEKVVDGDPGVAVRVLRGGVARRIRTRTWLSAAVRYAVVGIVSALLGAAIALWWVDREAREAVRPGTRPFPWMKEDRHGTR